MNFIRLIDVLYAWDKIKKGKLKQAFSIKIETKNGELRFYKRAVKSGTVYNLKYNEQRALIPVDNEGNNIGHVVPFSIWRIHEFNGKKVII